MTAMTNKLCQENPLCSSISLSEWMKHISPTVKIDDGFYILVIIVSNIAVFFCRPVNILSARGSIDSGKVKTVPFLEIEAVLTSPAQS